MSSSPQLNFLGRNIRRGWGVGGGMSSRGEMSKEGNGFGVKHPAEPLYSGCALVRIF